MSDEVITLREDLQRVKDELARVQEHLRQNPSLSHELRTPLNTVLGFAQLLKSSPFGDSEPVALVAPNPGASQWPVSG